MTLVVHECQAPKRQNSKANMPFFWCCGFDVTLGAGCAGRAYQQSWQQRAILDINKTMSTQLSQIPVGPDRPEGALAAWVQTRWGHPRLQTAQALPSGPSECRP